MEKELIIKIFIDNDSLDILSCVHKRELTINSIIALKEKLDWEIDKEIDLKLFVYIISGDNNILSEKNLKATIVPARIFNASSEYKERTLYKFVCHSDSEDLLTIQLKGREKNHKVVLFSDLKNELLMNKNNGSYFYNIDSLLSGRFIDNLVKELCNE